MKLQRILLNTHSKAIHLRKDFIKETATVYYPGTKKPFETSIESLKVTKDCFLRASLRIVGPAVTMHRILPYFPSVFFASGLCFRT